jgi:uncharacterized protein with NRDE domain
VCLIAFAVGADPRCPLLIAGNRDEFLDRPTAPLAPWCLEDGTLVFAGRDLRDGGTWLGLNAQGRVAMLTNVRSARPGSGRLSRGALVTRWLRGDGDIDRLASGIDPADYGGFNLVVGDALTAAWHWLGNRDPQDPHQDTAVPLQRRTLGPGLYGLSNAALDTPWPKTLALKAALARALPMDEAAQRQTLVAALGDRRPAPPHTWARSGVPPDVERDLSSAFVHRAGSRYGTRSSLIVAVQPGTDAGVAQAAWRVQMHEWTHRPDPVSGAHGWTHDAPTVQTITWPAPPG